MLERYPVEVNGLQAIATMERSGPETDEALILAPGLCSPELAGFRRSLFYSGYTAISVDQPRAPYMSGFGDVGELRGKIIEEAMTQARRQFGIGRCALVGHSLGGLDAIRTVQMADDIDTISSLELVASAGFTRESMSMMEIMRRLGRNGLEEVIQGQIGIAGPVIWNALRNPLQLVAEGRYGQRTDAVDALGTIANEIDTGIIQFNDDAVFPKELVTPRVRDLEEVAPVRNVVAFLPGGHSCHTAPICNPADSAAVLHRTLGNRQISD